MGGLRADQLLLTRRPHHRLVRVRARVRARARLRVRVSRAPPHAPHAPPPAASKYKNGE